MWTTLSTHNRSRGEGWIFDEEAFSRNENIQRYQLRYKVLVEEDSTIAFGCTAEEEVVHVEVLQYFLVVEQDAQNFEELVRNH